MKAIRRHDSRIWARLLYIINDIYNVLFIRLLGNLNDENYNKNFSNSIDIESKNMAMPTQTTWLLNIDRSLSMAIDLTGLSLNQVRSMRWIDVGCGNGISSLYAAIRFGIKNQYLFDLDPKCVKESFVNYNRAKSSVFNLKKYIIQPKIEVSDAYKDIIDFDDKIKNVIYMYNPFDNIVMEEFISKNINLISNGCIIIYINDKHNHSIKKNLIKNKFLYVRNSFYEISIFSVGL